MSEAFIKINHVEALNYLEKLRLEEKESEEKLQIIKNNIKTVNKIIKENDETKQNWILQLPVGVLFKRIETKGSKNRINWKKITIQLFSKYDLPMNTELLLNKAILNYNEIPLDKRFVLKNLSAALHYLVFQDLILSRVKCNISNRGFIYGLKNFFKDDGNIKPDYYRKYEMEVGCKF